MFSSLPSCKDFSKAYFTDDHDMANLFALDILNVFCVQKPLIVYKSVPIKLFVILREILKGYGISVNKSGPLTDTESIFEFKLNPEFLIKDID